MKKILFISLIIAAINLCVTNVHAAKAVVTTIEKVEMVNTINKEIVESVVTDSQSDVIVPYNDDEKDYNVTCKLVTVGYQATIHTDGSVTYVPIRQMQCFVANQ